MEGRRWWGRSVLLRVLEPGHGRGGPSRGGGAGMDEGEGKGGGDGCCENGEEEQRPQEEGGPHNRLGRVETRG